MAKDYKTESRMMIMEYLKKRQDAAVTVKEIHRHMEKSGRNVNLTTIYRYLDRLKREGKVASYVSENGNEAVYHYITGENRCSGHLHLKCIKCGKIIHLDCDFMWDIKEHISLLHDFDIQCEHSIIYGVCKGCAEKNAP